MNSGLASLHKVLKDETRRKIVLLLNEKGSLSYTDLMKTLEIDNTGRVNYHLKVLDGLVTKREDGRYALTEKARAHDFQGQKKTREKPISKPEQQTALKTQADRTIKGLH
jgi:predicted transcriptional regulator